MNDEPELRNEPDDPWLVDRLLADPTAPLQGGADGLGDLVAALAAPAAAGELAAEESYLQMFDAVAVAAAADRPVIAPTEGKSLRTIVIGSRAAIAAVVAVVAVSGAAAAYTGALPNSLQASAHRYLGAPSVKPADDPTESPTDSPTDEPTGTPTGSPTDTGTESPTSGPTDARPGVGPDATGPAAFGLCTAWSHGGLATTSVAYRNLETAAGGSTGITAYCAGVLGTSTPGAHGTGSPTSHPTGHPASHPTGSPTDHSHPGGSPTSHPGHH